MYTQLAAGTRSRPVLITAAVALAVVVAYDRLVLHSRAHHTVRFGRLPCRCSPWEHEMNSGACPRAVDDTPSDT